MFRKSIKYGFIFVAMLVLTVGCSSAQPAAPVAPNTAAPASQPTAISAAPTITAPLSSTAAPTNSSASASGAVTLQIVPDKSEVRYRVREQLAQVSLPSDAIGKTNSITGSIVGKLDGTIDASQSKFVVDLRTLQSDRSQRDNFLKRGVLQTDQYPNAVFVPKEAPGLPLNFPPSGPVSFKLSGDLTIRNVTKPVTWDVTCDAPQGSQGTCHATTSFKFEYFNIQQPSVPVVLSIVDNITLEMDAVFQKAS